MTTIAPAASVDAPPSTPAPPIAVSLRGLTKQFRPRRSLPSVLLARRALAPATVVDDVSFDVAAGGVFGLLGPNGAGKTTLFRMLATLLVPDAGTARIDGHDLRTEGAAVRRALSTVPADERTLNWRLSARENLVLHAALHRLPAARRTVRAGELLAVVGLADAGRKLVGAFSSGMRQRLLIARALIADPRILLLDEPTRSLDPVTAHELRAFLRTELVERRGCTILLATHHAEEAFGFCDRLAVLDRGRVLAEGDARALAARAGASRTRLVVERSPAAGRALDALVAGGLVSDLTEEHAPDEPGDAWRAIACRIDGGSDGSAAVVRHLADRGVALARVERVETPLAELIAHVVRGAHA